MISCNLPTVLYLGFPGGSVGKESACSVGDLDLIPGLGRSAGGGHGNPLQYSCLENAMDRGAWWATVHRVAKSRTRLNDEHFQHSINHSHCVTFLLQGIFLTQGSNPGLLHCMLILYCLSRQGSPKLSPAIAKSPLGRKVTYI